MSKITEQNFHHEFRAYAVRDGATKTEPSKSFVMIRPDRPHDHAAHRYADDGERSVGDKAMKAWFGYLAAKGFVRTFNAWRSILKSGRSVMVVCEDPSKFDAEYTPPKYPPLAPTFWDEFHRSRVPIDRQHEDPEMRERCLAIIKDCAASLRMNATRRAPEPPVHPLREWKSTPLAEIDATKPPPKLSAELRSLLGLAQPNQGVAE